MSSATMPSTSGVSRAVHRLHCVSNHAAAAVLVTVGVITPGGAHGLVPGQALAHGYTMRVGPPGHAAAHVARGLARTACAAPARVGLLSGAMTVDKERRTYLVYVPHHIPSNHRYGLHLAFHGGGGTARDYATYRLFQPVAEQHHVIIAYPDWSNIHLWFPEAGHNPDVDFASKLIATLEERYCIDARRIDVSGASAGGPIAHRVGCNLSSQIAAIALISGVYSSLDAQICHPAHAVSVIAIHGTADTVVPYSHGSPPYTSIQAWTRAWARRDGCAHGPVRFYHQGHLDGIRYTRCGQGTEIDLYSIVGGGHVNYCREVSYPGMPRRTDRMNCGGLVGRFFATHPRR